MMTSFSVLMPVYKGEDPKRFMCALESVYCNTLSPDETVVVCDGPLTPRLEAVLDCFRARQGFKVTRLETNQGIVSALNRGLNEVSYPVVVRCDSDDINSSVRFERLIACFDEGYDVVGSQVEEFDGEGKRLSKRVPLIHSEIVVYAKKRNPMNHMSVAYRTHIVKSVGGYPDVFRKEDYALWTKLIGSNRKFLNLPDVLVSASGGRDMYSRRGGFRTAVSEIQLQKLLVENGISSLFHAVFFGLARFSIQVAPSVVRSLLYVLAFRDRQAR